MGPGRGRSTETRSRNGRVSAVATSSRSRAGPPHGHRTLLCERCYAPLALTWYLQFSSTGMKRSLGLSCPIAARPPAVSANVAKAPAWMLWNGLRTLARSCHAGRPQAWPPSSSSLLLLAGITEKWFRPPGREAQRTCKLTAHVVSLKSSTVKPAEPRAPRARAAPASPRGAWPDSHSRRRSGPMLRGARRVERRTNALGVRVHGDDEAVKDPAAERVRLDVLEDEPRVVVCVARGDERDLAPP